MSPVLNVLTLHAHISGVVKNGSATILYFCVSRYDFCSFRFNLTRWLWFDLHRHSLSLLVLFLLRGCVTIRRRKCKRVPVTIVSTPPPPSFTPLLSNSSSVLTFLWDVFVVRDDLHRAAPVESYGSVPQYNGLHTRFRSREAAFVTRVYFCNGTDLIGCKPVDINSFFISDCH